MDIEELKALINSLLAEVQRLKDRVHDLDVENTELKIRLAQTSANSHKPPSSDGLAKKPLIKPALPKQAGKKTRRATRSSGQDIALCRATRSDPHPSSYPMPSSAVYPFRGRGKSWPADRCLTCRSPGSLSKSIRW